MCKLCVEADTWSVRRDSVVNGCGNVLSLLFLLLVGTDRPGPILV